MHEVLVNRLRGLSLPRKSVVRLTDRPDMTLNVYHGRKTKIQQQQLFSPVFWVMIVYFPLYIHLHKSFIYFFKFIYFFSTSIPLVDFLLPKKPC